MNTTHSAILLKSLPAPEQIELVIFDLGGVLLDIDYSATQRAFAELGLIDVDALYSKTAQSALFDNIERGSISPDEFRLGLRAICGEQIEDAELDGAWNALIGELPGERLEAVINLRTHHRTCLLSNTNAMHIECFEKHIVEQGNMDAYRAAFEAIYYSSDIGVRKPDAPAFQHVLHAMGVEAGRTLFIDDSEQHIHGALGLGMHAYHLEVGKEDILSVLCDFRNGLT